VGYKSVGENALECGQCFYFQLEGAASTLVPSWHGGAAMHMVEAGCPIPFLGAQLVARESFGSRRTVPAVSQTSSTHDLPFGVPQ